MGFLPTWDSKLGTGSVGGCNKVVANPGAETTVHSTRTMHACSIIYVVSCLVLDQKTMVLTGLELVPFLSNGQWITMKRHHVAWGIYIYSCEYNASVAAHETQIYIFFSFGHDSQILYNHQGIGRANQERTTGFFLFFFMAPLAPTQKPPSPLGIRVGCHDWGGKDPIDSIRLFVIELPTSQRPCLIFQFNGRDITEIEYDHLKERDFIEASTTAFLQVLL